MFAYLDSTNNNLAKCFTDSSNFATIVDAPVALVVWRDSFVIRGWACRTKGSEA